MNQPPRSWIPSEQQIGPFSGDSRYLSHLQVFSKDMDLELGANTIHDPVNQTLQDKITAALKLLSFREKHVIVQFWWPRVVGKHQSITTIYQPFGLGIVDVGLCTYRRDSESNSFLVDHKDHQQEDQSPVARIFRRGLPEWTLDLNSYTPKQFPQQACASRCSLHGYLGLPVFDTTTGFCVGVLEVLMSSGYTDYAHEVQNIHDALETVDLLSPQVFDFPAQINVPNEHRLKAWDKICGILKKICDIYSLPLAQTWALSQHASFVSHEKVLEKSCSSFDNRCVGKVCMSRTALPFHVQDMQMWPFYKASTEQHLDRSRGLVGKALLTRGSCFSGDVTELGEEEYPLVHNACMNGLTGCFTIFLHSVEAGDDYVLEFYLHPDMKEIIHVLNLVQLLKQEFEIASGFELGDSSSIQVVEPLTDRFANMVSDVTQTSSYYMDDNSDESLYSSDSESVDSLDLEMVTARITSNGVRANVPFPMSMGLTNLKNEVAHTLELEGEIRLIYVDEDNDLILIACDEDLKYAMENIGSNNSIDLICLPGI